MTKDSQKQNKRETLYIMLDYIMHQSQQPTIKLSLDLTLDELEATSQLPSCDQ